MTAPRLLSAPPSDDLTRETSVPAPRSIRTGDRVAIGLVLVWLVYRLMVSVAAVAPFAGQLADGPFQLFDALRRIADGQIVGEDFQFFHGVGVAYLHAPLYLLLGQGLFASEIARQVVSVLVFAAATYCGLYLLLRSHRRALRAGVVAIGACELFVPSLIEPGNSLLSVRSGAALILLLPIAWAIERCRGDRHPLTGGLLVGALAGAVFAMVTDQGLAVLVATVVALVVAAWRRPPALLVLLLSAVVGAAASFFVLLALLARSVTGALGAMHFALVDVPSDQFWYFGTPPNPFLDSWGDLFTDRNVLTVGGALLLCVVGLSLARRHVDAAYVRRTVLLLSYAAASMAPYLGITLTGYTHPALRVAILVLISLVVLTWPAWRPASVAARAVIATTTAVSLLALAHVVWHHVDGRGPVQIAQLAGIGIDGTRTLVTDGPGLDEFWSDYAAATAPDEQWDPCEAWYLYAGLAQARADCFGVQTLDYVIHALGTHRQEYLDDFVRQSPQFVETIMPRPFHYEEWVRTTTWPLYQELLEHYEPFRSTPYTLLWRRVEDNGVRLVDQGSFTIEGDTLSADPPDIPLQVLTVEVEYEVVGTSTPTTRLLAAPTGTRFALPLPINPERTTATFPLFPLVERGPVAFTTESAGLGNLRSWHATSATWRSYAVPDTPEWRIFLAAEDA